MQGMHRICKYVKKKKKKKKSQRLYKETTAYAEFLARRKFSVLPLKSGILF
jgi:hypothetical protein